MTLPPHPGLIAGPGYISNCLPERDLIGPVLFVTTDMCGCPLPARRSGPPAPRSYRMSTDESP